jgi:hypothetical protein
MIENTQQLIEQWPDLDSDVRTNLLLAVSSRGKNKGFLLANAPAQSDSDKWAAWSALAGNLAPARIGICGLLFGGPSAERYSVLDKVVTDNPGFLLALNAVEPAYRWNLWAHRYNGDAVLIAAEDYISERAAGEWQLPA